MMTQSSNTILKKSNQHHSKNTYFNPSLITKDYSPEHLHNILRTQGCNGCNLGTQKELVGPVIFKGNVHSRRMIISEAPGLQEDQDGIPFHPDAPAGGLLEKIIESVGYNIIEDFTVTNSIFCRPIAPVGSGKQNLTPTAEQKKACRPYVDQLISWVNPNIILLLGMQAVKSIIPKEAINRNMRELVGQSIVSTRYPNILFFVMWHPSYLCRVQGTPAWKECRELTWKHINLFKQLDGELNG